MKNAVLSLVCAVCVSGAAFSIGHSLALAFRAPAVPQAASVVSSSVSAPVSAADPPAPVAPIDATADGSILAQAARSSTAQVISSAQAAVLPSPGDDPRLDAWRIWLKSPEKGIRGPYTFWDVMRMKESFGKKFGMPGHAYEERDSFGNVTRVIWHTLDESTP